MTDEEQFDGKGPDALIEESVIGEETPHQASPHIGCLGWISVSLFSLVLAGFIHSFLFQAFRIPSLSMAPGLIAGDYVLVNKFIFGYRLWTSEQPIFGMRKPRRGEVVVFELKSDVGGVHRKQEPYHYFIKRIVGMPGDLIEVKNFRAFVNGTAIDNGQYPVIAANEHFLGDTTFLNSDRIYLKENEYYVLGDNRPNSIDSRAFGPIHRSDIVGPAFFVYWSWEKAKGVWKIRWSRIGRLR